MRNNTKMSYCKYLHSGTLKQKATKAYTPTFSITTEEENIIALYEIINYNIHLQTSLYVKNEEALNEDTMNRKLCQNNSIQKYSQIKTIKNTKIIA